MMAEVEQAGTEWSERHFRQFVENANDIIYLLTVDGRLDYASPNWRDALGGDPAEFVGKAWMDWIHPDDLPACVAAVGGVIADKVRQQGIEYRIRHADGDWRWHASNVAPLLDDQQRVVGVLGVGRDISKRKQAEEALRASEGRYRLLAENVSDVIWTMEVDGAISYVSPSVEKMRGITAEAAMAQPLDEIHPPGSQQKVLSFFAQLQEAVRSGTTPASFRGDLEYYRGDGSIFWGEVYAHPVINVAGRVLRIVGVTRDISERKHHEAEILAAQQALTEANRSLQEANAELARHRDHLEELVLARTRDLAGALDTAERASRAKSELLANMSHELRTPLNHITGFTSLLRREALSAKGLERIGMMETASARLIKLIDNLLDAVQLESDRMPLKGADFSLADLFDQVETAARPMLKDKSLDFVREVLDGVPDRMHGDALRLAQVLGELVDNAIKFSERGTVTLRVAQVRASSSVFTLRFEVVDQGIGVPLEAQASMFHLFVQGDGSSTRKYGGTGLGLALCNRIVNLMAGDIGLLSQPGAGTTFWIEIPFSAANRTQAG